MLIRDGDRARESRLDGLRAPTRKTEEAVGRRQNNGSVPSPLRSN